SNIRTRFLILSDTHGKPFPEEWTTYAAADVAIHCGDLTDSSYLHEFETTLHHLQRLRAPLKLVIAGNHDFTLDVPVFQQKVKEAGLENELDLVKRVYGEYGEARRLFDDTPQKQQTGEIHLLNEGPHAFTLPNGARLNIYASPYTPSSSSLLGDNETSGWGFQYPRHTNTRNPASHDFNITSTDNNIDVVITHGPPRGIFDYTLARERAGCAALFQAIAQTRPRMHCFGHIHEGWGAMVAQWRDHRHPRSVGISDGDGDDDNSQPSTHFSAIDHGKSTIINKLSRLMTMMMMSPVPGVSGRVEVTSHCAADPVPLRVGEQTLFVNAAVEGTTTTTCSCSSSSSSSSNVPEEDDAPLRHPVWLVDLDLPLA
ncbi:uncharacterized protein BO97DRAFT_319778, partial [Aspergillus homomorphus CBS 101889]